MTQPKVFLWMQERPLAAAKREHPPVAEEAEFVD
jgi:hypothetical protein